MESCRLHWELPNRGADRVCGPLRSSVTSPSCTTSRDWSLCLSHRARSLCSTTMGEESSPSCRKRRRSSRPCSSRCSPHLLRATSARSRAGSDSPCTRSRPCLSSRWLWPRRRRRRRRRSCGSRCPTGRKTSRSTRQSTRRSVSRCNKGRGGRRRRTPPRGALEGQFHVGVARDPPSHLVDAPMMLIAELHEVVHIRGSSIDPMPYMVHVGEFSVRAPGEPAPLVTPPDLHALRVTGVPACPSEVETSSIVPICRDEDFGVACQPPGDFSRDGSHDVELCPAFAPGQEGHVGVDDDGGAVAAGASRLRTACGGSGRCALA